LYQDLAATLKEYTRLERDPLAIYLTKKLPEGTEKVEGSVAFCKMFDMARDDGKCYYASKDELGACETGIHVLGMGEIDPAVRRGTRTMTSTGSRRP